MPVKPDIYKVIILISTLVFFLLPMLVISILYLLIGLHLHRERVIATVDTRRSFGPGSISTPNKQKLSKRNLQVTKMLCRCHFGSFLSLVLSRLSHAGVWRHKCAGRSVCVCFYLPVINQSVIAGVLVVVFGLCWAPFHVDRLMWSYINTSSNQPNELFKNVHIISGVLFYLSSAINPILYNLMSTRFREMFSHITCHSNRWPTRSSFQMIQRSTVSEKFPNSAKWT